MKLYTYVSYISKQTNVLKITNLFVSYKYKYMLSFKANSPTLKKLIFQNRLQREWFLIISYY